MGTQNSVPRTRRTYTSQFKAELIAACLKPGTSIAATAREQGMNANVLHRWLKEHRLGQHQITCNTVPAVACDIGVGLDNATAMRLRHGPMHSLLAFQRISLMPTPCPPSSR